MEIRDEKGFSLLELLVAITILTIGLLATATMLSSGIETDRFSYTVTVETAVATGVMEELLAKEGGDVLFDSDVAGATYDLDPGSAATTINVQGKDYSATYTIDANNPVGGVARIDVTVTSTGRSVTITSFKSTVT